MIKMGFLKWLFDQYQLPVGSTNFIKYALYAIIIGCGLAGGVLGLFQQRQDLIFYGCLIVISGFLLFQHELYIQSKKTNGYWLDLHGQEAVTAIAVFVFSGVLILAMMCTL